MDNALKFKAFYYRFRTVTNVQQRSPVYKGDSLRINGDQGGAGIVNWCPQGGGG